MELKSVLKGCTVIQLLVPVLLPLLQILARVPMVLKQLEPLVLHIMVISARLVLVTIIQRVVLAVPVWFVELGKDKRLLVLRELIVLVLIVNRENTKIPIHIPVLLVKVVLLYVVVVKDL